MVRSPYRIQTDGNPITLPGTGGITYNVKIGDPACSWIADHVEPGVSIRHNEAKENAGLNTLACIGNTAAVVSGEAKGAKGYVTGKHGGIEHVLTWFDRDTLERMAIGDKIQIRAWGTGLKLIEAPEVTIMNLDPELLEKMELTISKGVLEVPVTTVIPPYLMGSGIGASTCHTGDYDIMTADPEAYEKYGLDQLRLGDLVLLQDCDNQYGRGYLKGAVSVGVIVHSDCVITGHGPGVTTLFTCKKPLIRGRKDENANLTSWLNLESN
jgi:hypothetical protein